MGSLDIMIPPFDVTVQLEECPEGRHERFQGILITSTDPNFILTPLPCPSLDIPHDLDPPSPASTRYSGGVEDGDKMRLAGTSAIASSPDVCGRSGLVKISATELRRLSR